MVQKSDRQIREGSVKPLVLLLLAVLLAFIGYFSWGLLRGDGKKEAAVDSDTAVQQELLPAPAPAIEQPGASPVEPARPVMPPAAVVQQQESECERVPRLINNFFAGIDEENYLADFAGEKASGSYVSALVEKAMQKTPKVTGEKKDLSVMLANMAHFIRIFDKKDLVAAKEILARESERLEGQLALWHEGIRLQGSCGKNILPVSLPLPGLYEYACFFLNTLGGQSYLLRRESRLRILSRYYAVQIVDLANDYSLNRHGIDIRPFIASVIDDLSGAANLGKRELYIDEMLRLQDKYAAIYGTMS